MSQQLLLTLGHNSSAILMQDGRLVCGYETERITRKKSDSAFPQPVLDLMIKDGNLKMKDVDMVYATHWSPDGSLTSNARKHWDPQVFQGLPIRTLSTDLSHHDCHMAAAECYAGKDFPKKHHVLVIDGFGNYGEHLSVYEQTGFYKKPKLLYRVHGYETSLGLWYQYATAFLGMKMHEDEYKILGYETRIDPLMADRLLDAAVHKSELWMDAMERSIYGSKYDPVYDISALSNVKDLFFSHLTDVCQRYGIANPTSTQGRAELGFYVQAVLELVVDRIVSRFDVENLIVSGGVFHNVKLNLRLLNTIGKNGGMICAMPLCGDQGNALGLYSLDHPQWKFPEHLFWGLRKLESKGTVQNLVVVDSEQEADELVRQQLRLTGYVNLVRGAMEFGPRSLCHTSTLAIPTMANVERINKANDRNTVMPMAPVMTYDQFDDLFVDTHSCWKSEEHMIMALEYGDTPPPELAGIANHYSWPVEYETGRPQVTFDPWLCRVLADHGPLINTSFNFHGVPICFDMESIIASHMAQIQRDPTFTTVVVATKE